jgi:hypothetical protein
MVTSDLFNKFSYRYSKIESDSFLSPVRYFKAAMILLFKHLPETKQNFSSPIFTFDQKKEFQETDFDYLKYNGKNETLFVFRERLSNELNLIEKLYYLTQLLFVLIIVYLVAFFSNDKAKPSLILVELTELLLLSHVLKKKNCRELYIFSPYEKDMTLICFLLQKQSIKINLIPSSNPISTLYKNVICNTFIFTARYQFREYEKLKQAWFVNTLQHWRPFESNSVKLNNKQDAQCEFDIGLISSGMALREHLGHPSEYENRDVFAEKALVDGLSSFLKKNNNLRLIVYLHPIEKSKEEYLQFSLNYYKNFFGPKIGFAPLNVPSKQGFDLCSVAISVYSSTQIERLYGGYRTMFAPMGFFENFYSDDRLNAISVKNDIELAKMIEKLLTITDEDFFKIFNLMDYRWDSYTTSVNGQNSVLLSN